MGRIENTGAAGAAFRMDSLYIGLDYAIRADPTYWKVNANISGANPSLGTTSVDPYQGIVSTALTLTNNSGTDNLTAQIPCSGVNPPTGVTCSVGSESIGVSFTIPAAGDVLACVSFTHSINTAAASTVVTTFQIVETPNNAQTITQEGKTRIASALGTTGDVMWPYRLCGTLSFGSSGQKTIRLMYEQAVTGAPNSSAVQADGASSRGQYDIHWEVYPLNP